MTAIISPPMFLQFFDPNNSGAPAAKWQLFTYAAGTSQKIATYTDSTQLAINSNPMVLNASGIASIFLDPAFSYKYVLAPPNDSDPPTSPFVVVDGISVAVAAPPGSPGGADTDDVTPAGVYLSQFQAGYVQYIGPNGTLAANTNFIFGLAIPNPSGTPCPALLIGSGVPTAAIVTDTVLAGTPGTNLIISAGETDAPSTDLGGKLSLYGGAAHSGIGGGTLVQGGTSLNGQAGDVTVAGGTSTNGSAGHTFIIGGQQGTNGGNVHLIMTDTGHGNPGSLFIRCNSNFLYTITKTGAIFIGASGAGLPGQPLVSGGPNALPSWQTGFTGTIVTTKLTSGGTPGTMTFSSGILVSQVQST